MFKLEIDYIIVKSRGLPAAFSGFRIAHVSDLHNYKRWRELAAEIENGKPDIIVISGDIVDRHNLRRGIAEGFIEAAVKIAPVYFAPGNHEADCKGYPGLAGFMIRSGVKVLENAAENIVCGGESITIGGLSDPWFLGKSGKKRGKEEIASDIAEIFDGKSGFKILISHRPELFGLYAAGGVSLAFSGHAHGGLIRLPFRRGFFAPHQGMFPKITAGRYIAGESQMIVSRGLGDSFGILRPFRLLNRPNLIFAGLEKE